MYKGIYPDSGNTYQARPRHQRQIYQEWGK